ncbi:MAG: hypothetical protein AAFQ63_12200 [Cyanobacteria bacterium J06621_11]
MVANLSPSDPLGQKLCRIFSYRWLAIAGSTYDPRDPKWRTVGSRPDGKAKFQVKERTLWRLWNDVTDLVGVRFGNYTRYFLIDIDKGSKFLSADGLDAIKEALETIGIVRTVTIRSSGSGGVHIYAPLPEAVPTFDLACAVRYALEAQEIYIEAGQVEVFPNTKAYGRKWLNEVTQYNAHRLPLQVGGGSYLLNHSYQPDGASLAQFFSRWEYAETLQDVELLVESLSTGRDAHRKKRKQQTHPAYEWQRDLEFTIEEGWTGPGQTNRLLKEIGCYGRVFLSLSGEELAAFIESTATKSNGYKEFCQHQFYIRKRAAAWGRAVERYYWPLGTAPKRTIQKYDHNAERAKDAIARIKQAVLKLVSSGELAEAIGKRRDQICQIARTSATTLYKHLSLWHPSEWCVQADCEGDTANLAPEQEIPPDRVKPSSDGLVHTSPPLMKGERRETPLFKNFHPDSWGLDRGPGKGGGFPQAAGGC